MEVVADPKTGAISKAEKITDADDLKEATSQKATMAKAKVSLLAAAEAAVKANAGSRAVSIVPELKNGGAYSRGDPGGRECLQESDREAGLTGAAIGVSSRKDHVMMCKRLATSCAALAFGAVISVPVLAADDDWQARVGRGTRQDRLGDAWRDLPRRPAAHRSEGHARRRRTKSRLCARQLSGIREDGRQRHGDG